MPQKIEFLHDLLKEEPEKAESFLGIPVNNALLEAMKRWRAYFDNEEEYRKFIDAFLQATRKQWTAAPTPEREKSIWSDPSAGSARDRLNSSILEAMKRGQADNPPPPPLPLWGSLEEAAGLGSRSPSSTSTPSKNGLDFNLVRKELEKLRGYFTNEADFNRFVEEVKKRMENPPSYWEWEQQQRNDPARLFRDIVEGKGIFGPYGGAADAFIPFLEPEPSGAKPKPKPLPSQPKRPELVPLPASEQPAAQQPEPEKGTPIEITKPESEPPPAPSKGFFKPWKTTETPEERQRRLDEVYQSVVGPLGEEIKKKQYTPAERYWLGISERFAEPLLGKPTPQSSASTSPPPGSTPSDLFYFGIAKDDNEARDYLKQKGKLPYNYDPVTWNELKKQYKITDKDIRDFDYNEEYKRKYGVYPESLSGDRLKRQIEWAQMIPPQGTDARLVFNQKFGLRHWYNIPKGIDPITRMPVEEDPDEILRRRELYKDPAYQYSRPEDFDWTKSKYYQTALTDAMKRHGAIGDAARIERQLAEERALNPMRSELIRRFYEGLPSGKDVYTSSDSRLKAFTPSELALRSVGMGSSGVYTETTPDTLARLQRIKEMRKEAADRYAIAKQIQRLSGRRHIGSLSPEMVNRVQDVLSGKVEPNIMDMIFITGRPYGAVPTLMGQLAGLAKTRPAPEQNRDANLTDQLMRLRILEAAVAANPKIDPIVTWNRISQMPMGSSQAGPTQAIPPPSALMDQSGKIIQEKIAEWLDTYFDNLDDEKTAAAAAEALRNMGVTKKQIEEEFVKAMRNADRGSYWFKSNYDKRAGELQRHHKNLRNIAKAYGINVEEYEPQPQPQPPAPPQPQAPTPPQPKPQPPVPPQPAQPAQIPQTPQIPQPTKPPKQKQGRIIYSNAYPQHSVGWGVF